MRLHDVTQSRFAKKFRFLPLVLLLLYANTHSRESLFSTSPLWSRNLSTAGASATKPQDITERDSTDLIKEVPVTNEQEDSRKIKEEVANAKFQEISSSLEKEVSIPGEQEAATELEKALQIKKEQLPSTKLMQGVSNISEKEVSTHKEQQFSTRDNGVIPGSDEDDGAAKLFSTRSMGQEKPVILVSRPVAPSPDSTPVPKTKKKKKKSSFVPPGFENLLEPQTTEVDVYFGGLFLLSTFATYTPTDLTFAQPDAVVTRTTGPGEGSRNILISLANQQRTGLP